MSDVSKIPLDSLQSENNSQHSLTEAIFQPSVRQKRPAQIKESVNDFILESAARIIGVNDDPLLLVLNSVIDKLNELLALPSARLAIKKSVDNGLKNTSTMMAEHIVSVATDAYNAYAEQYPDDDVSELLNQYVETVSSAIERGFNEAKDILVGLDVLQGRVADDIDAAFKLIQEELLAFAAVMKDLNMLET